MLLLWLPHPFPPIAITLSPTHDPHPPLSLQGHQVSAYDVSPAAVERLAALGGVSCPTPAAVAAASDQVVTMLPNSQHVRTAYTGPDGLLRCGARGAGGAGGSGAQGRRSRCQWIAA